MTDFKKWRLALIAGLSVPALALTACSSDDDASADSGADSDASTATGDEASGDDSEFDVDLSGAPAGFELTPLETRLGLGETAQVLTQNSMGNLQFWDVTVSELKDLPADTFELEDETDVDHFVCVNYEMTLLGNADDPDFTVDDDTHRPTFADGEPMNLTERPDLMPLGEDDAEPNSIYNGDAEDCGIDREEMLGSQLDEVEVGKAYKDADVSFVSNGSGDDAGIEPIGGKIFYPYALRDRGFDGTIYWER
ncbi:hypothetical protein ACT3SZ_07385 [Corynebacterium sp. AOP40-9SA-29]|uniref:hypothetical protein n=1 Tax=Corynebacterium sp. AOP40-9SA-29 TaxID=3457677 RepID=UPI004033FAD9